MKQLTRKCYICKGTKSLTAQNFYRNAHQSKGFSWSCKNCDKKRQRDRKEWRRDRYQKLRKIVLQHYGGDPPKCADCGCNIYEVLELDHINNDGAQERKRMRNSSHLYQEIIKKDYPSIYQVLCKNCNWLKFRNYEESLRAGKKKRADKSARENPN